jgi:hypothetical protein
MQHANLENHRNILLRMGPLRSSGPSHRSMLAACLILKPSMLNTDRSLAYRHLLRLEYHGYMQLAPKKRKRKKKKKEEEGEKKRKKKRKDWEKENSRTIISRQSCYQRNDLTKCGSGIVVRLRVSSRWRGQGRKELHNPLQYAS